MTPTKPLTASERSARALLAAWNSGELVRLEAALDGTANLRETHFSSCESERMELVREVADSIRVWMQEVQEKTPTDLNAALKLLRHLAGCEMHAPIEVLQSGTLACVQN